MRTKSVFMLLLSILLNTSVVLAQQQSDYFKKVKETVEKGNFRIDIMNVIQEGKAPVAIFSTNFIELKEENIKAKLPYFYRDDSFKTATKSDISLDNSISKINIKNRAKTGRFEVNLIVFTKKSKNKIKIDIDYQGYAIVKFTDSKGRTVMYDGRLKLD